MGIDAATGEFRADFASGGNRVAVAVLRYDLLGRGECVVVGLPRISKAASRSLHSAFEIAPGTRGSLTHFLHACLAAKGAGLSVSAGFPLNRLAGESGLRSPIGIQRPSTSRKG